MVGNRSWTEQAISLLVRVHVSVFLHEFQKMWLSWTSLLELCVLLATPSPVLMIHVSTDTFI